MSSLNLEQETLSVGFSPRSEEARYGFDVPAPVSIDSLSLTRLRDKQRVNIFLEEFHQLGGVTGWKAAFGAEYKGYLVAVCIVGRPANPTVDDGNTIYIDRLAARPDRPHNTSTWLIARARDWCVLEGYDTLVALAGISDNTGKVYKAAGMTCENFDDPDTGGGDSWQSRSGRQAFEEYDKRRWVEDLQKYRER